MTDADTIYQDHIATLRDRYLAKLGSSQYVDEIADLRRRNILNDREERDLIALDHGRHSPLVAGCPECNSPEAIAARRALTTEAPAEPRTFAILTLTDAKRAAWTLALAGVPFTVSRTSAQPPAQPTQEYTFRSVETTRATVALYRGIVR